MKHPPAKIETQAQSPDVDGAKKKCRLALYMCRTCRHKKMCRARIVLAEADLSLFGKTPPKHAAEESGWSGPTCKAEIDDIRPA